METDDQYYNKELLTDQRKKVVKQGTDVYQLDHLHEEIT